MDALIIFCATYLVWGIVGVALVYLFFSHEWKRFSVFAAVSLVVAYGVGKLAEMLWYNTRPFVVDGTTPLIAHAANNGFPSSHTLLAATIASIIFVYNRKLGTVLWVLALAVGLSRVAAHIHHLIDIAGSVVIAVVVVWAIEYLMRRRSSKLTI